MKKVLGFSLILVAFIGTLANATIINVPGDCPTIQAGIDSSSNGDTVLVQPGTYVENLNFNGHNIVIGSLFLTTGDTSFISTTIIDGDSAGSVVTFESGETVNSVIEGFTITNGSGTYFDPYWEYGGGGIYCNGSAPTIQHNIVTGNTANNGGGIGVVYTSPVVIKHNIIFENSANVTPGRIGGGGGIAIAYNSDAEVSHNDIYNNFSGKAGGGIAIAFDCNPEVMYNTIRDNVASDYGGGIQIYSNTAGTFENNIIMGNSSLGSNGAGGISCRLGSYSVIANNIIVDNSAATYGGGIRCFDNATPTITNNLISGNEAGISGGGLECDNGAFATITNTILWDNDAPAGTEMWIGQRSVSPAELTISHSDVEGGMASVYVGPGSTINWGAGMIDNNPLLRSPGAGDFHLMAIACGDSIDSPCIDMGDPTIEDFLLDCDWGLGDVRSDMGAYGGGDSTMVGIEIESVQLPDKMIIIQNYPNPFNSTTILTYDIPQSGPVTFIIYNILGQRVVSLYDGLQQAGHHTITWDASNVSSGIYFAQLQSRNQSTTVKMLLLK